MRRTILLSIIICILTISIPHGLTPQKATELFNLYKSTHSNYKPFVQKKVNKVKEDELESLFSAASSTATNKIKFNEPQRELISISKDSLYGLLTFNGSRFFGRFTEDCIFNHIHYNKNFTNFKLDLNPDGTPDEAVLQVYQGRDLLMFIMDNIVKPGALGEQCMYTAQLTTHSKDTNDYMVMSGASVYDRFYNRAKFIILGADQVSLRGEIGQYEFYPRGNATNDIKKVKLICMN